MTAGAETVPIIELDFRMKGPVYLFYILYRKLDLTFDRSQVLFCLQDTKSNRYLDLVLVLNVTVARPDCRGLATWHAARHTVSVTVIV